MKLGVAEWALGEAERATALARAKELGFRGVELTAPVDPALRAAADSAAIPIVSVRCHLPEFAAADIALRSLGRERLLDCVETTHRLGAGIVTLPLPFVTTLDDYRLRERLREDLTAVGDRAEVLGVIVACQLPLAAAEQREFLRVVDHEMVRCDLDLSATLDAGRDAAAEIRALGSQICHVHLRGEEALAPPGSDAVRAAVAALRTILYPGFIVVTGPLRGDPAIRLQAVRAALAAAIEAPTAPRS